VKHMSKGLGGVMGKGWRNGTITRGPSVRAESCRGRLFFMLELVNQ